MSFRWSRLGDRANAGGSCGTRTRRIRLCHPSASGRYRDDRPHTRRRARDALVPRARCRRTPRGPRDGGHAGWNDRLCYSLPGGSTSPSTTPAHQGGPLGEDSIENGLLRCPWHGWDFDPLTGESPGAVGGIKRTLPPACREDRT
ncbi:Rieske (2Fe-2S) protein [Salinigranum sp.]|uniref:Rieske (2Fe-2S) protein n=1 Tax=Salinigranum sp. TaxID=1966351 RepID=UPI0035634E3F